MHVDKMMNRDLRVGGVCLVKPGAIMRFPVQMVHQVADGPSDPSMIRAALVIANLQ